jgi:hypothetical protein
MGCAAAIFSEPDQVALFFEQPVEQHPDTPVGDSTKQGPPDSQQPAMSD